MAPQGLSYEITVTLTYGEQDLTPRPVTRPSGPRGGAGPVPGRCHLHAETPRPVHPGGVAQLARSAGLEFINPPRRSRTRRTRTGPTPPGTPARACWARRGRPHGRGVAVGADTGAFADWRYRARDTRSGRYARQIRRAGGPVVPADPHAPCIGCNWVGLAETDAGEVRPAHSARRRGGRAAWNGRGRTSCVS
ncbi:CehA/McbA family metallohydrolase OS=Streptomyces tendae OX=1932 GN=GUR47_27080 PE=4 SV=1 [Streptomyces tendae]